VNKYTAIGLLTEANVGRRIIIASTHQRAARDAAEVVHQVVPDLDWRRTNSHAELRLPSGGAILFLTRRQMRGHSADIVVVEDDHDLGHEYLHELRAVIHTSGHGEIVRY
jgi:hypothetical protein